MRQFSVNINDDISEWREVSGNFCIWFRRDYWDIREGIFLCISGRESDFLSVNDRDIREVVISIMIVFVEYIDREIIMYFCSLVEGIGIWS